MAGVAISWTGTVSDFGSKGLDPQLLIECSHSKHTSRIIGGWCFIIVIFIYEFLVLYLKNY